MRNLTVIKLLVLICITCLSGASSSVAQIGVSEEYEEWGSDWETGGSGWETAGSGWETVGSGTAESGSGGWGEAPTAEISETGEAYFPSSIGESSDALIDESASSQYSRASSPVGSRDLLAAIPGGSRNLFWIVSSDGSRYWRSVSMPLYRYARLLLIPSASGPLILEERYPTGQIRTYNFGNVWANNQYRLWFYADSSGTYQARYRIGNGPYSDILTFHVGGTTPVPLPVQPGVRPNIQIITQAVDPATNRVYYSYNQQGLQIFKIKVLVTGPDLYRIRSVHYKLHPTFSPSEQTMTNPRNNFELELWTWGAFNMPITVTTTDGRAYRYDYYFTFGDQLRDAQRRGVPFVRV
jgi:hypothetical protein